MLNYAEPREDCIDCSTSSTFSSFVFGFMVLYNTKLTQANPTIPLITAITCISRMYNATLATNNAVPTKPARIACLCCVVLVDDFYSTASHGFISVEEGSLEALGVSVGTMLVSSVNIIRVAFCIIAFGRSLMYNINKRGPKIDPCGMPRFTFFHFESDFTSINGLFS